MNTSNANAQRTNDIVDRENKDFYNNGI
jgi:hypothetical protein